MRYFLVTIGMLVAAGIGCVLGWNVGVAMSHFPGLGLTPEKFWRTDPEQVWAWAAIIGALVGVVAAVAVLAWRASKKTRSPKQASR